MLLPVHVSCLSGDTIAHFDADSAWEVSDLFHKLLVIGEFRICTLVHCESELQVSSKLLEAGFTENVNQVVAIFKTRQWFEEVGISMKILMTADADATARRLEHNLKGVGYTAKELRTIGYTASELRKTLDSIGKDSTHQIVMALRDAGFSFKEILDAGYTTRQLRETGIPLSSFVGCSAKELVQAGFTFEELYRGGRNLSQLLGAGFTVKDAEKAGFKAGHFYQDGHTLPQLYGFGFSAGQLKQIGLSAAELATIGYTARQLKLCYNLTQVKEAGFSLSELKDAGYTAWVLAKSGSDVLELRAAGFSDQELADAGFVSGGAPRRSFPDLRNCSVACASRRHSTLSSTGRRVVGVEVQ